MSDGDRIVAQLWAPGAGDVALRVDFRLVGDRLAHWVVVVGDAAEYAILESIEGAGDEPWPPSPALQALNRDQLLAAAPGDNVVAALVGMSGRSHWSLGIEPAECDGRPALLFDAACRVKQLPPAPLGSSYGLLAAAEASGDAMIRLPTPAGTVQFAAAPLAPEAAPPSIELTDGGCRIANGIDDNLAVPATLRWRYRMELFAQ